MAGIFTESQVAEMMHGAGLRPSVQRIAILSYIVNLHRHPTADEIFCALSERYPSLSRTTVYNTVHALVDAGLVRTIEIESGSMRYDLAPQPRHSHFMCRRCGRIFDVSMPDDLGSAVSPGFSIDSVDVYFKGLCPECGKDYGNHQ